MWKTIFITLLLTLIISHASFAAPASTPATTKPVTTKPASPTSSTTNIGEIPKVGLPDPGEGVRGILVNFLRWLLGIFGVVALISFVISGLQYFFSRGEEKMMQTAKRNMLYSVMGVIVALSGVIVITAMETLLKGGTKW